MKGMFVKNDVNTYLKKVNKADEEGQAASRKTDIGFFQSMFCSMVAGGTASILTNPLDMAKLRLQVQRAGRVGGGNAADFHYKHLVDAVYKIGRDEGALSLLNGSFARILYHVPMVAISMGVLEQVKPKISKLLDGREWFVYLSESSNSQKRSPMTDVLATAKMISVLLLPLSKIGHFKLNEIRIH